MIKGDNVYLRLTEKYDLNRIMDIYKETVKNKFEYNKHKKYIYDNFNKILSSPLTCLSIINEKDVLVGFTTYIEEENDIYKFGITIGERFRNRGYGKEVINLIKEHLFAVKNAKSITLEVEMNNESAISCYNTCGFVISEFADFKSIKEDIMKMELINDNYKYYERKCS